MASFIHIADTAHAFEGERKTTEQRLDEWRLQTYYRGLPLVLLGLFAGSLLAVYALLGSFDNTLIVGWLCLHTAMLGYRAQHYFMYRHNGIENHTLAWWQRHALMGPIAGGVVWAIAVIVFMPTLELPGRMLLIFIIGGFSAAAVGITSAYLPSLYAWTLTAQLTVTLMTFATADGPTEFSMGVMLTFFTVALLFFGNSNSRSMQKSFVDATRQAALQSEVSMLEARTRSAIEHIPSAVALFDGEDRLVIWNHHAVLLFPELRSKWQIGTPFIEIIKSSPAWLSLGHTEENGGTTKPVLDVDQRLAQHNKPQGTWEVALHDGRWLQVQEARMPDGGYITSFIDITNLKREEIVLREAKNEAERANQAKSQFLALMSHELRTPLNAILGFAEGIKSQQFGDLKEEYVEYATVIKESGNHLLAVINDILDLSKIEAGQMTLMPEKIDPGRSLQSALRILQEKVRNAELEVLVEIEDDLPALMADARAVHQMLLNLLANAIKFTAPGGKITMEAKRQGDDLLLVVTDTGIGIAPKDIEAVLRPFAQVEDTLRRTEQGTGLGVPLTKSLMELHGGKLEIFSKLEHGTRMCLVFPPDCIVPASERTPETAS